MLRIEIENWTPVSKGRARASRSGHHYTPQKTRDAERLIGLLAQQQCRLQGWEIEDIAALELDVEFRFPFPASLSQRNRRFAEGLPKKQRPDLDNCLKLVKDALNGIVWGDDAQVCRVSALKIFSENPGCTIEVRRYEL